MSKYLIVFDLDSTLIHSVRNPMYSNKSVCIGNNLAGVPTSFMTPTAIKKLDKLLGMNCDVLVITTRSLEEYRLLDFSERIAAYTANGAIKPDGTEREKFNPSESVKSCLNNLAKYFDNNNVTYKNVNDKFVQITGDYNYGDVVALLKCSNEIEIMCDGKRTFFIPKVYSKGTALLYHLSNRSYDCVITCGDSVMDYSMFRESDIVFTCDHSYRGVNTFYFNKENYTDELLDRLIEMVGGDYV